MNNAQITTLCSIKRQYWIEEIVKISGNFGQDLSRIEQELNDEINQDGTLCLLQHLRLCGTIPENYGHDSSEEKLYSKYTDCVISEFFKQIGLDSIVLK